MRIKAYRESAKLTTIKLGEMLGVSASAITNWETGIREPNIEKLKKMSQIFDCSIDELVGNDVKRKES